MQNSIRLVLVAIVGLTALHAAPVREIHLGLSPFLGAPERDSLVQTLPARLLETTSFPGGTRLVVWDAWNLTTIVDFTIPVLDVDTPRSRTPRLAGPLGDLGRWLRVERIVPTGIAAGSGAVRAPEMLFEIGALPATGPRTIILVGSPFYRSPMEPAFDMATDARYPSDGHLALDLSDSVFGLAEKSGRLAHTTVLWCYPSQSIWAHELHRHSVTRFWTLFVQGQGGTLATFGSDLRATLARATQTDLPPVLRAQPEPEDAKPLMRSARPRTLPSWLVEPPAPVPAPAVIPPAPSTAVMVEPVAPPPAPIVAPAPVEIPVVEAPAQAPVMEAPPMPVPAPLPLPMPLHFDGSKTGVGIAWSQAIDLDLHVRLRPGAKELYYHQDRTAEGFLYKDERKANAGRFFEFVEFNGPSPVDLSRASIWIHYYGGRAENVTGQVVLFDCGTVRVGTFSLRANKGNGSDSSAQRAASPYWVEIRLADLVEATAPLAAKKPKSN